MIPFTRLKPRPSPSSRYHRRLACVPIPTRVEDQKPEGSLALRAIRRFPALTPQHRRDAYDTFRSDQHHARHRVHGI
jgi:hypothetical protein